MERVADVGEYPSYVNRLVEPLLEMPRTSYLAGDGILFEEQCGVQ